MTPITNLISKMVTESATPEDFFAVSKNITALHQAILPYADALRKFGLVLELQDQDDLRFGYISTDSAWAYSLFSFHEGGIELIKHRWSIIYNSDT